MEASTIKPGAGYTGDRGSREPDPVMQKNICLYQKTVFVPYCLAGSREQSHKNHPMTDRGPIRIYKSVNLIVLKI